MQSKTKECKIKHDEALSKTMCNKRRKEQKKGDKGE
jgi:hypothetical protein